MVEQEIAARGAVAESLAVPEQSLVERLPSMGPRPRGRGISSSCILLNFQ